MEGEGGSRNGDLGLGEKKKRGDFVNASMILDWFVWWWGLERATREDERFVGHSIWSGHQLKDFASNLGSKKWRVCMFGGGGGGSCTEDNAK